MALFRQLTPLLAAITLAALSCGEDAQVVSSGGGTDTEWNLSGYQLTTAGGASFTVPAGTVLRPGGYVVIVQGSADEDGATLLDNFLTFYEQEPAENLILFETGGELEIRDVQFTFVDNEADLLDGPAPAAANDETWQRLRGDYDADDDTAWERTSGGQQINPGWGQEDRVSPDYPYISEVSDGSDVHPFFSFVEIYLGEQPESDE